MHGQEQRRSAILQSDGVALDCSHCDTGNHGSRLIHHIPRDSPNNDASCDCHSTSSRGGHAAFLGDPDARLLTGCPALQEKKRIEGSWLKRDWARSLPLCAIRGYRV